MKPNAALKRVVPPNRVPYVMLRILANIPKADLSVCLLFSINTDL